jgi:succinyl-diaminopimelate desuccinylase
MDWQLEAEKRRDQMIPELQQLIAIPSILSDDSTPDAPFGKEVKRALEWFIDRGETNGFEVKSVDHVAAHLEIGKGQELLGILGHVDVVPAGEGWKKDPFGGEVAEGKLYGRGAIDDKGPTIAAWTALNMVKDAGVEFSKRVRLIIGTDEESGFRCVERYFQTEEMPTIAFAPDADFPIIHAEKGIADLKLVQQPSEEKGNLMSFSSGDRTNMVPDRADAIIEGFSEDLRSSYDDFCAAHALEGSMNEENGYLKFTLFGKSAHAMEPDQGINAGVLLALFLSHHTKGQGASFLSFIAEKFYEDSRGRNLNLNFSDDVSGETTFNAGIIRYDGNGQSSIDVSMRYSVNYPLEEELSAIDIKGFDFEILSNSPPHYVDENDPFIKTLQASYEKMTGEKADLLAIGGGTYARVLNKGVAFGMLFPGEPDVAHQSDEFVDIDNLVKATAIYAEAIYQLACKK